MTAQYGTGGRYTEDPRDYPVAALFDAAELKPAAAIELPPSYADATMPRVPVLNQLLTPRCVAYAASALMTRFELLDRGLVLNLDEAKFAGQIRTTPAGAYIGDALERMLHNGYPTIKGGDAGQHRIKAYYKVPTDPMSLKQALIAFGPLDVIGQWHGNWYDPPASGVLPSAGSVDSGHDTVLWGYNEIGAIFRNSWGSAWGHGGNFTIRWADLNAYLWAAYKTVDLQAFSSRTVVCAGQLRTSAGTSKPGPSVGSAPAGMKLRVAGTVKGAKWTTTCAKATSKHGDLWYAVAVINGRATGLVHPGHERLYIPIGRAR